MHNQNDDMGRAVGCVVLRDRQVLLVRHTYGPAKERWLIPGGYLKVGETPEQAASREVLEETGVTADPVALLGMRFNLQDWYAIFRLDYQHGEPRSDQEENSAAAFFSLEDALALPELTDLSRVILEGVMRQPDGEWRSLPFRSRAARGPYSLYGVAEKMEP